MASVDHETERKVEQPSDIHYGVRNHHPGRHAVVRHFLPGISNGNSSMEDLETT